jgi:hypothetical protein
MQNAAGSDARSDGRNDSYPSIVSDLASLMEHVQASIKLLDLAIARETSLGNQDVSANIVVLDDVTPRYAKANAALNACNAGLGIALHFLRDTKTPKPRADGFSVSDRRSAGLIGRA